MPYSFFDTAGNPFQAFFDTPEKLAFFDTSYVGRLYFDTPRSLAFFDTPKGVFAFYDTFPQQRTTSLILTPGITSIATDCTSISLYDNTGVYPVTEGGYTSEIDVPTATRPRRSEIQLWLVLRLWNADGTFTEIRPDTQTGLADPWTFVQGLAKDGIYQIFLLGPYLSEEWTDWAYQDVVSYAQTYWYAGSITALVACDAINCVNDARYRLAKAILCGECETEEWVRKRAVLRTIISNVALGNNVEAAKQLVTLTAMCEDENCKCNC